MIAIILGIFLIGYGVFASIITFAQFLILEFGQNRLPDISVLQVFGIIQPFQQALYIDLIIALGALVVGLIIYSHKNKKDLISKI